MLALAALVVGLLGAGVIARLRPRRPPRPDGRDRCSAIGAAWIGTGLFAWCAPPGQPHRRADDLDRLRVAAERVRRRRRARGLHARRARRRTSTWRRSCTCCSPIPRAASAPRAPAARRRRLRAALVGPLPILMFGFDARCDATARSSVIQVTRRHDARRRSATSLTTGARGRRSSATSSGSSPRRWRAATPPAAPHAGAAAVVGHRADGAGRGHARRRRPSPATQVAGRRSRCARPDRLRRRSRSRSWSACCAAASRAPTRSASCCVRLGEAPGTDGLRGLLADALDDAVAAAPLLGRRLLGHAATAARPSCRRDDRALDAGRARGPARRRDRPRRAACARARGPEHGRRRRGPGDARASAWRRALRRSRARIVEAGLPGAPAAGAQPARRRPAAARRALA